MEQNKKFKLVSSKKTRYLLPNILTLGGVCLGISSIKFAIDASIAALPVPLIGSVKRLLHCQVYLRSCWTSDINDIYASSKWPIGFSERAFRTSGCAFEGPGPNRSLGGT